MFAGLSVIAAHHGFSSRVAVRFVVAVVPGLGESLHTDGKRSVDGFSLGDMVARLSRNSS